MNKIEDIKRRGKMLIIIGSKKEVLAELDKLAKEEKKENEREAELLETVDGCWSAFNLKEKVHVLEKAGYELET